MLPFGETITVKRAGTRVDPYSGENVEDWATATTFEIEGCAIYPTDSVETASVDKTSVVSGYTVLAPPGSDVRRKDRVSYRGADREVVGDPFDWRNPFTGWTPGVAFEIEGEVR
jgi:hypothetical protein